jgi:type II restriction/modification system DNA methylase subunit YeeA
VTWTLADRFWVSVLYLYHLQCECEYEQFIQDVYRDVFARYSTPSFRRLEKASLRTSPFIRAITRP